MNTRRGYCVPQDDSNPEYSAVEQLSATETGLIRYTFSIVKEFKEKMKMRPDQEILDFGAGIGFLPELFRDNYQINPTCVELDPNLCQLLNKKGFQASTSTNDIHKKFDVIYTSNVLEHIEKDKAVLEDLRKIMQVNGQLGVYVPALPFLFSEMDYKVGHVRRYRRKELKQKLELAGFKIEYLSYDDFVGVFASLFIKLIGFGEAGTGSAKSLQIYDRFIFPLSNILDKVGFKYLIGKNLIAICTIDAAFRSEN